MSPKQQSRQYNILAQRLAQLTPSLVRTQQAEADYLQQLNQQRANAANGLTPGGPTSRPAMGFGPGAFAAPSAPNPNLQQPLKIDSLADGVTAPGLHGLLTEAEKLMRDGKFETAIKKYNVAARVAPNNGLIPLGRANAELAAGYYYQASADLHQVFQADPALLMGQYGLQNWIGDKRLEFITKELTDLSKADPKQETAVFLLAYISYNTGHESAAESYLSEARRRAGTHDPLLNELQSHWKLSAAPSPIEGNK
jgi:tetratricopeptide (TPR) repeat protein